MNPENAERYKFHDGCGLELGGEAFYHMLAESGASIQHASKEYCVKPSYFWLITILEASPLFFIFQFVALTTL